MTRTTPESGSHPSTVVRVGGANRIVELGGDSAAPSPAVLGQVRGGTIAR